jgi:hypothetical protein
MGDIAPARMNSTDRMTVVSMIVIPRSSWVRRITSDGRATVVPFY